MAAIWNRVTLMGRVMGEPDEVRAMGNGGTVTKFRLAAGRSKKNPQTGQWEPAGNQLFIDCEVFSYPDAKRNLVDIVTRYVKKGDSVMLEGELKLDEWQSPDGQKRSKHVVAVRDLQLVGGGKGDEGGDEGQEQTRQQQRGGYQPQGQRGGNHSQHEKPDADIPFSWLVPILAAATSLGGLLS